MGSDEAAKSEEALIEAARAGDRRALDTLLRRYHDRMTGIAFRTLGPGGDVEDVVQEALIQVCRSIGGFEGRSTFSTWLYRVVTNVARMHIRALQARPRLAGEKAQSRAREDAERAGPELLAVRHERMARLYELVHALSEKKRTVLVLHDFEGMSPAEIADLVEAPVMTVRTRLFYARRDLYAAMARDPELAELVPRKSGERDARGEREATDE